MSEADSPDQSPKAIIHKQILDTAETNPDAPIERIADEVSGASTELIERVLEKYGDPAGDNTQQSAGADTFDSESTTTESKYDSPEPAREEDRTASQTLEHTNDDEEAISADRSNGETPTQPSANQQEDSGDPGATETAESVRAIAEELSEEQREVLRAISEHPEATQAELAQQFDVTAGTISRWVNEIPGFEWQHRNEFVTQYAESLGTISDGGEREAESEKDPVDAESRLDALESDLDRIQDHISELEEHTVSGERDHSPAINPELMAKVVRACVADDQINDDEEITILTELLR